MKPSTGTHTNITPVVYITRPSCKWHAYDCRRPVADGNTLCAFHLRWVQLFSMPRGLYE